MAELAAYVPRMRRDYDPAERIVQQIEDQAKFYGVTIAPAETAVERMQALGRQLGLQATGPDALLAVFDRSGQYTNGGILVPDKYLEDKVQGKVALILSLGPLCCGEEYERWFGGPDYTPKIGEWWITSIRDGLTYLCGRGLVLKTVEWKHLRMRTLLPDIVM